jgi:hypothetical protein
MIHKEQEATQLSRISLLMTTSSKKSRTHPSIPNLKTSCRLMQQLKLITSTTRHMEGQDKYKYQLRIICSVIALEWCHRPQLKAIMNLRRSQVVLNYSLKATKASLINKNMLSTSKLVVLTLLWINSSTAVELVKTLRLTKGNFLRLPKTQRDRVWIRNSTIIYRLLSLSWSLI